MDFVGVQEDLWIPGQYSTTYEHGHIGFSIGENQIDPTPEEPRLIHSIEPME
jgi:hypothetical protein